MDKIIDFRKTVYELATEYPEFKEIMASVGFKEITEPEILASAGKVMTVPKGSRMKGIPMEQILKAFREKGFQVIGVDEAPVPPTPPTPPSAPAKPPVPPAAQYNFPNAKPERAEALKGYLERLSKGESLETVREDFRKEFHSVEAAEIMQAEQQLMKDGMPLEEVQKLCDIHSALFHGATQEERVANAEREVAASMIRISDHEKAEQQAQYGDKNALAAKLIAIPGHPLETFTRENQALALRIESFREAAKLGVSLKDAVHAIREVTVHYAKKGDLLYPLLKVKYDVTGPSSVMWTVDDEIRDELGRLDKASVEDEAWKAAAEAVVQRADEMIYKETNILFPICAVNFTEDEWKRIYRDSKDYENCLGVESKIYAAAEEEKAAEQPALQVAVDTADTKSRTSSFVGEVVMPGGHLKLDQLEWLLNTIPMEITFVDADNINRYFNESEGQKAFKRPKMALDREVFSCHPPKIEPMVRQIITEFRSGRQSSVSIWAEKGGKTMLVNYRAVRDQEGNYLGTAEFVQDMEFAKRHFQQGEKKHD
jgi:hypothetical protein